MCDYCFTYKTCNVQFNWTIYTTSNQVLGTKETYSYGIYVCRVYRIFLNKIFPMIYVRIMKTFTHRTTTQHNSTELTHFGENSIFIPIFELCEDGNSYSGASYRSFVVVKSSKRWRYKAGYSGEICICMLLRLLYPLYKNIWHVW